MTKSLRDQEGYFMADHRGGPAVPDHILLAAGLPVNAGRGLFEAPTFTCSHCQAVVILNPNRQQDRHYCRRCDHLICDTCAGVMAQTKECRPFSMYIDEVLNKAVATR